jgi:hypothetical protein
MENEDTCKRDEHNRGKTFTACGRKPVEPKV